VRLFILHEANIGPFDEENESFAQKDNDVYDDDYDNNSNNNNNNNNLVHYEFPC
jgi:hypothetical protein